MELEAAIGGNESMKESFCPELNETEMTDNDGNSTFHYVEDMKYHAAMITSSIWIRENKSTEVPNALKLIRLQIQLSLTNIMTVLRSHYFNLFMLSSLNHHNYLVLSPLECPLENCVYRDMEDLNTNGIGWAQAALIAQWGHAQFERKDSGITGITRAYGDKTGICAYSKVLNTLVQSKVIPSVAALKAFFEDHLRSLTPQEYCFLQKVFLDTGILQPLLQPLSPAEIAASSRPKASSSKITSVTSSSSDPKTVVEETKDEYTHDFEAFDQDAPSTEVLRTPSSNATNNRGNGISTSSTSSGSGGRKKSNNNNSRTTPTSRVRENEEQQSTNNSKNKRSSSSSSSSSPSSSSTSITSTIGMDYK